MNGLRIQIELQGACDLNTVLARTRRQIGETVNGQSYRLSVICLGCGAVRFENRPLEDESHASDCSTACAECPREP